MTFQINGAQGKYDNIAADDSVKYGRNAVENNRRYMESPITNNPSVSAPILDFSGSAEAAEKNIEAMNKFADKNDAYLDALPPLEFEYRYMPEAQTGTVDKKAVKAAAYEEMGEVEELPIEEFESRYLIDDTMTAEPLDINKDGKIDNSEYAANIIAADILSKDTTDVNQVDGTINAKGLNAVLEYSKKSNAAAAEKLYGDIYKTYNLGEA